MGWQSAQEPQKDRFNRFLAEVDQSISEGDQHVAFKTLKLRRPWQWSHPVPDR